MISSENRYRIILAGMFATIAYAGMFATIAYGGITQITTDKALMIVLSSIIMPIIITR